MGDAEVEQAHEAVLAEEDVRRLEVAVDDALRVDGDERAREVAGDGERGVDVQGALTGETVLEVFAREELGDQARPAVRELQRVEDGDDVRGGGARQGLGFALEPLEGELAGGEVDAEDFDGHRALETRVSAAVEQAHAATSERRLDLVGAGEDGPDEGVRGERSRRRAVSGTDAFGRAGAADGATSQEDPRRDFFAIPVWRRVVTQGVRSEDTRRIRATNNAAGGDGSARGWWRNLCAGPPIHLARISGAVGWVTKVAGGESAIITAELFSESLKPVP